jgi:hypothetical protein
VKGENGLEAVALAGVCKLPWACAKAVPCVMIPGRTAAAPRPGEGCPCPDTFVGGGGGSGGGTAE